MKLRFVHIIDNSQFPGAILEARTLVITSRYDARATSPKVFLC